MLVVHATGVVMRILFFLRACVPLCHNENGEWFVSFVCMFVRSCGSPSSIAETRGGLASMSRRDWGPTMPRRLFIRVRSVKTPSKKSMKRVQLCYY